MFTYRQEVYQLSPGDRLLLYSDGAYELRDAQGGMLGLPRLADIFAAAPPQPELAIRTIQEALNAFGNTSSPHDDTTLLCARIVAA
jgi:serine phosphatase RsbU (regulator of sigma subunit)